MTLIPDDPRILATTVADSLIVAHDRAGRYASLPYWERAQPWVHAVSDAAASVGVPEIVDAAAELCAAPASYRRYEDFRTVLCREATDNAKVVDLLLLGWRAQINTRLGYHIGCDYVGSRESVTVARLLEAGARSAAAAVADPKAVIVIPFRDTTESSSRLRNLLSCLLSLRDQSIGSENFCVTVVETDEIPRWGPLFEPFCDQYVFAPSGRPFNRSWAVNVGVRNTPGDWDLICVMDADVLADRDFVRRNVERFLQPGASAVLPYRDMLCLDASASDAAIAARVEEGVGDPPSASLRGFSVRRPPGCCGWIRRESFDRVGGMDERYEGWGGEDTDFAFRANLDGGLDRYPDRLLHLHHDPSADVANGEVQNLDIAPLSWPKDRVIGELDKYAPVSPLTRGRSR